MLYKAISKHESRILSNTELRFSDLEFEIEKKFILILIFWNKSTPRK